MKEGSNGDVSAEQAHGILPWLEIVGFLYRALLGLAFCRAWIILYLSAATVTTLVTNSNWAFLLPAPPLPLALPLPFRRLQRRINSRRNALV